MHIEARRLSVNYTKYPTTLTYTFSKPFSQPPVVFVYAGSPNMTNLYSTLIKTTTTSIYIHYDEITTHGNLYMLAIEPTV